MRRISSTTRWLAGLGIALVAMFSVFFADRASSGGSNPAQVTTPATVPPTGSGDTSTPAQPVPASPPISHPQRHTSSGAS
jgi:hypothetical protein